MTTPSLHPTVRAQPLALAVLVALLPATAAALEPLLSLKVKGVTLSEETTELGTYEDRTETYLDLQPQFHVQFSPKSAFFVRGQAFVTGDQTVTYEQDEPQIVTNTYTALREVWFDLGGVTTYPGEVLRLGLQRVRQPDGLWYDRDIEAARWIFDTTLFQSQLGIAKAYDNYRSDDVELPESQKDRAYAFIDLATQWMPLNFFGIRAAFASDQRDLPPNGAQMEFQGTATDPETGLVVNDYAEPEQRRYTWFGAFLDNRFYEFERGPGVAYRLEIMGLTGERDQVIVDPATGQVVGRRNDDVGAMAGEAGVRVKFSDAFPLQVGGAYAWGEGGRDDNGLHDFRQTGLQSNRSRFTGTRTIVNRFNEALQADLTNLRVTSGILSLPLQHWDFSAVTHKFERDDGRRPVHTDGTDIRVDPASSSTELGTGWDFVVTRHFTRAVRGYSMEDDRRTNVRLRASSFSPGAAYADGTPDQTRVTLEGTLWF